MSNTIQTLVNAQVNKAKVAQTQDTRFMLVITDDTREQLRDLCDKLGVPQIKFASSIFTVALQDAVKAYNEAKGGNK